MKSFKVFDIDLSGLSEKEKEMVDNLIEAGKIIAELYEEQKDPGRKGNSFYPPGVSKEEIARSAKENEDILHPYTFVEEAKLSDFKPVFFSSKFKKRLKKARGFIKKASRLADKDFSEYLEEIGSTLLDDEYGKNEVLWVTYESKKFNFMVGPVERYLDRLFFKKSAYQGWLGITNRRATDEANRFKDIILASRRKILPGTSKAESEDTRIDINETIFFAGQKADFSTTGTNLPNDPSNIDEYGSRMTIFESSMDRVFENMNYPLYQSLLEEETKEPCSKEELKTGLLRLVILHEISHTLVAYDDAEERLEDLFPVFDELLSYILGIRACNTLVLKDVLEKKDVKAIIATFIARSFRYWQDSEERSVREDYARGCTVALNFFLEEGGLKRSGSLLKIDFSKLFLSIDRLSRILEYHLATSNMKEAKEFLSHYNSQKIFRERKDVLNKILETDED